MGRDRKRAIALKAADAHEMLKTSVPFVFNHMSQAQIAQVQKVLDAAVVNPAVQQEYQQAIRGSIVEYGRPGGNYEGVYYNGRMVLRDVHKVRRAERVLDQQIAVSPVDKRIRLDAGKLLAADALKPRTDNPDEALYLKNVGKALEEKDVWLHIDYKLVRDPEDAGHWMIDPRSWQAWITFGADGDTIPIGAGAITREILLKTTAIGAGYWTYVHNGPVQRELEKQIKLLESQMEDGIDEHDRLIKRHRDAPPLVAEISDFVGGADLPDRDIWDHPHKLLVKALEARVGGNVTTCRPYLIVAAIIVRNNAQLLAEYADDSSAGAGTVVKILKVAKAAGEVAEVGLTVVSGAGIIRSGMKVVGKKAATDVAQKEIDDAATKLVNEIIRKDPSIADDLDKVRWIPGPKGTISGNRKGGHSSGVGEGFHRFP